MSSPIPAGAKLCFVDIETTGLDPDRHEIWEVGLLVREAESAQMVGNTTDVATLDREYHWFLPVDLTVADPFALGIGHFHKRHPDGYHYEQTEEGTRTVSAPSQFAKEFARLTSGAHLVGAVVSFDEERLRKLLFAKGLIPNWHYHLVDCEALIAGRYGIAPPWSSSAMSRRAGVDPDEFEKHTALGDAKWARAMYDAVMGRGIQDS